MSDKPVEPEVIVSDGVQEGSNPVPREEAGDAAGRSAGEPGTDGQQDNGGAAGTPDSRKVPGPAEEDDAESTDDRGLTTDTTPD